MIRKRPIVQLNTNPKDGLCNKKTKMQNAPSLARTRVYIVRAKHNENTYTYIYKSKEKM